ncbi:MAG TPA: nuclear transport factor 2 family protein [Myxococcota bacterium]|nr:nuclear transport factor 2 family protein [Myxococcota bacterium]
MLAEKEARAFADAWAAAWNAHDLERIVSHYCDDVTLTSPVVVQLLGQVDGTVVGKPALRAYFARGLAAYPQLRFDIECVAWGVSSVVVIYRNQCGTRTAEFMELAGDGRVRRVVANYDG